MKQIAVMIFMSHKREFAEKILSTIGIKARFHDGDLPSTFADYPIVILPISAVDDFFDPLDYDDYSDFSYTKYCRKHDLKQLMKPPFSLAACYSTIEQLEELSVIADKKGHEQPRVWYWHHWVDARDVRTLKMHPLDQ